MVDFAPRVSDRRDQRAHKISRRCNCQNDGRGGHPTPRFVRLREPIALDKEFKEVKGSKEFKGSNSARHWWRNGGDVASRRVIGEWKRRYALVVDIASRVRDRRDQRAHENLRGVDNQSDGRGGYPTRELCRVGVALSE